MVKHVRLVGGLMIAQGILSCVVGLIFLAALGPLNFVFMGQKSGDLPAAGPLKFLPCVYMSSGLLILTSGILNVTAGIRTRKFRSRAFAIVALITNVVHFLGLYSLFCLPSALAVMVFGLVVLLNEDVRRAFTMGAEGFPTSNGDPPHLQAAQTNKPDWFSRNWKWLVAVFCLVPVLVCGGFAGCLFFGLQYGFRSSDVYKDALSRAQTDPAVTAALGSPIEPGLFATTGNMSAGGTVGHAELSFPISGPKGSGKVHLVADKSAGKWEFKVLDVEIDGTNQQINLLEQERENPVPDHK